MNILKKNSIIKKGIYSLPEYKVFKILDMVKIKLK